MYLSNNSSTSLKERDFWMWGGGPSPRYLQWISVGNNQKQWALMTECARGRMRTRSLMSDRFLSTPFEKSVLLTRWKKNCRVTRGEKSWLIVEEAPHIGEGGSPLPAPASSSGLGRNTGFNRSKVYPASVQTQRGLLSEYNWGPSERCGGRDGPSPTSTRAGRGRKAKCQLFCPVLSQPIASEACVCMCVRACFRGCLCMRVHVCPHECLTKEW